MAPYGPNAQEQAMADGLNLTPNSVVEVPAPRGTVRIGQHLPVAFIAGP